MGFVAESGGNEPQLLRSLSAVSQSLALNPRLVALPFEALPLANFFFVMLIRSGVDSVMQNEVGSIRSRPMPFQLLRLPPDVRSAVVNLVVPEHRAV